MYRNVFRPLGAIVCWGLKLFKGELDDELIEDYDLRNKIVGVIFIIIIVVIIAFLNSHFLK